MKNRHHISQVLWFSPETRAAGRRRVQCTRKRCCAAAERSPSRPPCTGTAARPHSLRGIQSPPAWLLQCFFLSLVLRESASGHFRRALKLMENAMCGVQGRAPSSIFITATAGRPAGHLSVPPAPRPLPREPPAPRPHAAPPHGIVALGRARQTSKCADSCCSGQAAAGRHAMRAAANQPSPSVRAPAADRGT
ncbi:hypothetical protein SEVIR_9G122501v4 [Setaria viridis]